MRDFDLIVAVDATSGIGRAGRLPWPLRGDMRHFRETTRRTADPARRNAVIMGRRTWESLPNGSRQFCDVKEPGALRYVGDDYAFFTHSLGSRIMIDSLQSIATWTAESPDPVLLERVRSIQDRRIPVFMLSNQLPLLQLGQPEPKLVGQTDAICKPGAPKESERLFDEVALIAFSDPNDLFSYAIPPGFLDKNVDSRLCPTLVNVVINVADVFTLFGVGEVANPMTAHVGYDNDERVIGLVTHGFGGKDTDPEVAERCVWMETI